MDVSHADDSLLPVTMQAKTLEIIDQIIAVGDDRKELMHLGSPLLAWDEELIGHNSEHIPGISPKQHFLGIFGAFHGFQPPFAIPPKNGIIAASEI